MVAPIYILSYDPYTCIHKWKRFLCSIYHQATSALDTATERNIQASLNNIAKNRTTLMVAHRLSTIVHADEILVMHQGEIVERGTHSQLIATPDSRYAQLWREQSEALLKAKDAKPASGKVIDGSSSGFV